MVILLDLLYSLLNMYCIIIYNIYIYSLMGIVIYATIETISSVDHVKNR